MTFSKLKFSLSSESTSGGHPDCLSWPKTRILSSSRKAYSAFLQNTKSMAVVYIIIYKVGRNLVRIFNGVTSTWLSPLENDWAHLTELPS